MLFIVATPIGNLADLSERALSTLRTCDLILCEDTRHSSILLRHYAIQKPLFSYHRFNEQKVEAHIIEQLKEGRSIALISDAGTPLISDPGHALVQACLREGLSVTAIPGPCSLIHALLLSGFDTEHFQFIGFLPRKQSALQKALRHALLYRGTTIAFESPERLIATLEAIASLDPGRRVAVARELTKIHEECHRGSVQELLEQFRVRAPRGEMILLIEASGTPAVEMELEELVHLLQELHGFSFKDALKTAAKFLVLPTKNKYKYKDTCSHFTQFENETLAPLSTEFP
jgi:16S rRNA (cytidine1402-2'-O)-methyltransferase